MLKIWERKLLQALPPEQQFCCEAQILEPHLPVCVGWGSQPHSSHSPGGCGASRPSSRSGTRSSPAAAGSWDAIPLLPVLGGSIVTHLAADVSQMAPLSPVTRDEGAFPPGSADKHRGREPLRALPQPPCSSPGTAQTPESFWRG